jgi:predicted nucleic acid-binding Zn ribbon protein
MSRAPSPCWAAIRSAWSRKLEYQRPYEVVGGVHQSEEVAAVVPAREVGDRDEGLQGAVARPGPEAGE